MSPRDQAETLGRALDERFVSSTCPRSTQRHARGGRAGADGERQSSSSFAPPRLSRDFKTTTVRDVTGREPHLLQTSGLATMSLPSPRAGKVEPSARILGRRRAKS